MLKMPSIENAFNSSFHPLFFIRKLHDVKKFKSNGLKEKTHKVFQLNVFTRERFLNAGNQIPLLTNQKDGCQAREKSVSQS